MMTKTWDLLEKQQPVVMRMLKNMLQRDRIAHAYLFEGMKGTGKRETAIVFSKAIFCENLQDGYKPCEACVSCKRIDNRNNPDLHIIEPDGASIKIDQIRYLQQEFSKKAVESEHKVYIVVDADKMTVNAANSLLKFLEEPDGDTIAILITEQIQKILPTILSRCQLISFQPLPKDEIIQQLIEMGISPDDAPLFAHLTNNIDEAYALKDDEWLLQARKLVLKLNEIMDYRQFMDTLLYIQTDWLPHFKTREEVDKGLDMLLYMYRDILAVQLNHEDRIVYPHQLETWKRKALHLTPVQLAQKISAILEAKKRLNANVNSALLMEQLAVKLQEG
mgnify:CR=1 FL=1